MASGVRISPLVAAALADGRAVVALESTVFSQLGLPGPAGAEARKRVYDAVSAGGAVPALTVILDGEARVGVDDEELPRVIAAEPEGGGAGPGRGDRAALARGGHHRVGVAVPGRRGGNRRVRHRRHRRRPPELGADR